MKDMVTPIVIGALRTIFKGLVKGSVDMEIKGQAETIQTTALLRSARILRIVLESWGDFKKLVLTQTPGKSSQRSNYKNA